MLLHIARTATVRNHNMCFGWQHIHNLNSQLDGILFLPFHHKATSATGEIAKIMAVKAYPFHHRAQTLSTRRLEEIHLARDKDIDEILIWLAHDNMLGTTFRITAIRTDQAALLELHGVFLLTFRADYSLLFGTILDEFLAFNEEHP